MVKRVNLAQMDQLDKMDSPERKESPDSEDAQVVLDPPDNLDHEEKTVCPVQRVKPDSMAEMVSSFLYMYKLLEIVECSSENYYRTGIKIYLSIGSLI